MVWDSTNAKEIYEKISCQPFYIFGTGVIGRRFFDVIREDFGRKNFRGFLVTQKGETPVPGETVYGLNEDPDKSYLICVAVHDSIYQEVRQTLLEKGFRNMIWVYPGLLDMELGTPVIKEQSRDVRKLVAHLSSLYPYAIYYLAIEDLEVGNGIGKDAYLWLYGRGSTEKTATERLKRLQTGVGDFNRERYDDYPIRISRDEDVVADGAHRLMLARYFGVPEIRCDIYSFDKERFLNRMKWFFVGEEELRIRFSGDDLGKILDTVEALKQG